MLQAKTAGLVAEEALPQTEEPGELRFQGRAMPGERGKVLEPITQQGVEEPADQVLLPQTPRQETADQVFRPLSVGHLRITQAGVAVQPIKELQAPAVWAAELLERAAIPTTG